MWLETLLLLLTLLCLFYVYITKHFGYFKSKGIPEATPSFPWGSENTKKMVFRKLSALDFFKDTCEEFKNEKVYGVYAFRQRQLVVHDLELGKHILIKDADHFVDRPTVGSSYKEAESLSDKIFGYMLTNMSGEEWKKMRAQVSPVFTSGKLKLMVPHIDKCARNLGEVLSVATTTSEVLDAKEIFGKFSLDAIATAGFGMETNSFKDPDNTFRITALRMTRDEKHSSKMDILRFVALGMSPKICKALGITALPSGTAEFFASILRKNIEGRRKSGMKRNDVIDLIIEELIAAEEKGTLKDGDFDLEVALVSTCILFFFAGFDTTSTTLSAVVFALAKHPEVQEKLRQEVWDIVGKEDDIKVTADHLKELKYMEYVINETLRKFGIVQAIQRKCTKDYKLPGTDFTIPEGMIVNVHAKRFQAECFANPDAFDPSNFDAETNPNKFGFVAFGQGPRNCIGMRYAYMALKLAILHTVRSFKVVVCSETADTLQFDVFKNAFVGCKFKVEKLREE